MFPIGQRRFISQWKLARYPSVSRGQAAPTCSVLRGHEHGLLAIWRALPIDIAQGFQARQVPQFLGPRAAQARRVQTARPIARPTASP